MTRSSAFTRLGAFACLFVFGLPAESEGCWLFKCCKRTRPAVVYIPTGPDELYEAAVEKKKDCEDPYRPAKCDLATHMWVRVSQAEKEACVHQDYLDTPCGMVADPAVNDMPDHLFPAILVDQKAGKWERTPKGQANKTQGFLPKHHLPRSQF